MSEYFFEFGKDKYHQFIFGHKVLIKDNEWILTREEFNGIEEGKDLIFKWFNLDDTKTIIKPREIFEELKKVDGVVEAVNFNEPKQTVIAGEKAAIEKACEVLKEAGARRAMPLAVSGPFHSSLMQEAGERLKEEANKYNFNMTDIKLVANTNAEILTSVAEVKEEIYRQSFGPVKWVDTINKLKSEGVTTIYEIGPGKVLAGLIKKIDKEIEVKNIEKLEDLSNI